MFPHSCDRESLLDTMFEWRGFFSRAALFCGQCFFGFLGLFLLTGLFLLAGLGRAFFWLAGLFLAGGHVFPSGG